MTRRLALLAALALAALSPVSCGNDDDTAAGDTATTAVPSEGRPPTEFSELEAVFNPLVEDMGLRLTRGALIDRSDNGYEVSETGRHLALYVEPIDDEGFSPEIYLTNFYDLTAILSPYVFDRWSELDTFDICQEPPTTRDDRPEPYPETQIDMTRAASEAFDWANSDLVDLLALDLSEPDVRTIVGKELRKEAVFTSAYDEAQQQSGVTTVPESSPPSSGY